MNRGLAVVQTGTANTASVLAALRRQGLRPRITSDAAEVLAAPRVVLPGVGAFAAAMQELREKNLVEPLRQRIEDGRPTLAICLGLQLLTEGSEESPGEAGLGVVSGRVRRFPETARVPQLGWNEVWPDDGCELLRRGHAYFANSYRLERCPAGWSAAFTDHAGRFVAAMERGAVLSCQFHPELSGEYGRSLLQRWIERGEAAC